MDADKRRSWAVDDVDYTCLTTLPLPSKLHVHNNSDSSGDETSQASSRSKRAKLSRAINKRTSPIKAFFGRFKSGPPSAIPEEADPTGGDVQPGDRLRNSVSENRKKRMKLLSDLRFKLSSGGALARLTRSRKSSPPSDTGHHRRIESQDSGYGDTARLSDVVEDTASYLDKMIFSSPVATPTGETRERAWTLPNQILTRTSSFAGSRSLDDKPPSLMADMLMAEVQEKMKYKQMVENLSTQENSDVEIRPAVETNHSREGEVSDASEPMEVDSVSDKLPAVLHDHRESISSLLSEELLLVLVDNEYVMDTTTHRELVSEIDQLKDQLLALQTHLSDSSCRM